jgi:hypothetical protein
VRGANLLLFRSLTEPMLRQVGNANGYAISARAMLYVLTATKRTTCASSGSGIWGD